MPVEISDEEILIRAVTTYHVNAKGKPRPALFKHPDDRVSVSRRSWVAPWLARLYAKARIENLKLKKPKLYIGLAFVSADDVRIHGATVVDSREEYLGHADIRNGIVQRAGEALPPDLMKELDDRAKAIADSARVVMDPNPNSFMWTGSEC